MPAPAARSPRTTRTASSKRTGGPISSATASSTAPSGISLAFAVRDALRAGSLFLAHSRDHVSFWNLVYDDRSWQQAREQAYGRLDLPADGQAFLARLGQELNRAARAARRGLPGNRFAAIRNGRLKLKRRDALLIPPVLRELRATIAASLSNRLEA